MLVAARVVQGIGAAVTMPTSMALVRQAFPGPARRAHAVGVWAMGGAMAAAAGPVLGGVLSLLSWRMIFWINLPVGVITLLLLSRTPHPMVPLELFRACLTPFAARIAERTGPRVPPPTTPRCWSTCLYTRPAPPAGVFNTSRQIGGAE
ncbi:MFS transporter [Streptomyces sp. NPDC001700]